MSLSNIIIYIIIYTSIIFIIEVYYAADFTFEIRPNISYLCHGSW